MHKGYTLNYFIDFFSNIPDHRWTQGTLRENNTVKCCALGHCLARVGSKNPNVTVGDSFNENARTMALQKFLGGAAADINDGDGVFKYLGATPRGRILRALRNRKRKGVII